jgi:XTP/dITP diphosphohydrolase
VRTPASRDLPPAPGQPSGAPTLQVASSNSGKLNEYREMALGTYPKLALTLDLLPRFAELEPFQESAPTFAENAVGKALHYSRFTDLPVLADDSGLAVAALGGLPGVHSARYAGPGASDAQRTSKLLAELAASGAVDRSARFVCIIALAVRGRVISVTSDSVAGVISAKPSGSHGFGYDPVFFFPLLGKTFAEISQDQQNLHSHRGGAFRKLLEFLTTSAMLSSGDAP